jgi:zinc protease
MVTRFIRAAVLVVCGVMVQAKGHLVVDGAQRWMTATGMQVAYVHVPNGIINIEMTFDAGASRDGAAHGLAALTGALIDSGGATLNVEQIAGQLASTGTQFSVDVARDAVSLRLQAMAEPRYFDSGFGVFTDMLAAPAFTVADFRRVKNQLLQGIALRNQDPESVAFDAFYAALYGSGPYGHPISGEVDTVTKLTPKVVKQFYGQYYCAANANLVIVGDIDLAHAKHLATKIDATLPVGQQAEALPALVDQLPVSRAIVFPSTQSTLVFGKRGIAASNPDLQAIRLASDIVGGGLESRLGQEVREKQGLVYHVYSQFIPMRLPGPYFVTMQTQAKQAPAADKATHAVLESVVQSGVTEAELAQAKQTARSAFYSRFLTNASIAGALASQMYYDLPDDYFQNYLDNLNAVTLSDVNRVIRSYMALDHASSILVGPNAKKT